MTRRQLTWLLAVMLAVPVLLLTAAGFLAGTESGTRWLLRAAEPYLPAPLSIGETRGSLLAGLAVDRLSWSDETTGVEIRNLGIDLELLPLIDRQIRILSLTADGVSVDVAPGGDETGQRNGLPTVDLPVSIHVDDADIADIRIGLLGENRGIDRIRLAGSFNDSELSLEEFSMESAWAGLDLEGTLRLSGRYPARLSAAWRFSQTSDQNTGLQFAGNLELDGDLERYDINHDLERPLQITTLGSLEASGDEPVIDVVNTWDSIDWIVSGRRLTGTDGRLQLRGTLNDLDLDLDTAARVDDFPEAQLSLVGNTDLESIRIDTLTLRGEPATVSATGSAGWAGVPAFDVDVTVSELDASLAYERLTGTLRLDASASGTLGEDGPAIAIDIAALRGDLNGQPLSGSAGLRIDGTAVSVTDGTVRLGANSVMVTGTIANELDLRGTLDMKALQQLDARLHGDLGGRFALAGRRDAPALEVRFEAGRPGWNDISADSLTFEGRLAPDRTIESSLGVSGLVIGNLLFDASSLTAGGSREDHRFELELGSTEGRLALAGTGSLTGAEWLGQIATLDVNTRILDAWTLQEPVRIAASSGNASLTELCLASRATEGRICATADYDDGDGGTARLDVRRLPLAALPFSPPAGATVSGYLETTVDLTFDTAGIRGTADARLQEAAIEATYENEPYRLSVTRAVADIDIDNNRLVSTLDVDVDEGAGLLEASLDVADIRNTASLIDGRGSLAIPDASIFGVFVPDLANAEGRIGGNLTVGGSLNVPDLTGEVLLEDAAFDVRRAGIRVSGVNLSVRQRSAGQLKLEGSARSGEGRLTVEGETRISAETGLRTDMRFDGENFRLLELPGWQVAASPDIRLVLDDRVASVTGSLDVPSANISVKSVPDSATRPSSDVVVHGGRQAEAGPTRNLDVNVVASLGDDVRLSAFGLTTNVTGTVRIRGGSNRPFTGTGSLSLIEGRYKAYGQNLEIENGELIFNGPLESPQLDVQAVRRLEQYDVTAGIRLTGTPSRLNSTVYSEPPLSDAETLSYLLSGRPLSSASGDEENADILNKAAFALGLSQAGSIASQIQGDLGLDVLKVEGGADSRIVAGKRIGDRLLVEYGYGLIDKLGTLMLRYELTNRLVLESRTGTTSELDVVYSVKVK